jgi:hypothetical protein
MPVNSLSGSLSTSVYFASMFLLLFVIAAPVGTAFRDANQRAAQELASGIATQIDDLSPGMQSSLILRSSPGISVSVSLSGSSVTAVVDGQSASAQVRWDIAQSTLVGGRIYTVALGSMANGGGPADSAGAGGYGVVKVEA